MATALERLEPGPYAVVVASADSEQAAKEAVAKFRAVHPALFEPKTPLDASFGDGYYRDTNGKWVVYAGGLHNWRSAQALKTLVIQELKLSSSSFVVKPL